MEPLNDLNRLKGTLKIRNDEKLAIDIISDTVEG